MDKIVLENISYTYPLSEVKSIDDISLTIKQGEFCAIIGPNGSGKTTLLNVIRGFVPKFYEGEFTGRVLVDGQDIAGESLGGLAVRMGYVFQNPFTQISGHADTVFEELAYGLENMGIPAPQIIQRVEETMELLNIGHLQNRNPFDLSGGQQQRVAFASIIAMEPDIFVIDEPTSQLDPQGTEEIFGIIAMMKAQKKTVILVEHKMELIAQYADHVILLRDGKVALDGIPQDILASPDLETQYGTAMSRYAKLGLALEGRGWQLPTIPIAKQDAYQLIPSAVRGKVVANGIS